MKVGGTFRLSVVVALLVAAYYGITGYMTAIKSEQENQRMWMTLRCGERFLDRDMSRYAIDPSRPEVIDIGKAGCSDGRFLATFEEIRGALASPEPPEWWRGFGHVFRSELEWALFAAFGAFMAVNLAGFLFRWVLAGYRDNRSRREP